MPQVANKLTDHHIDMVLKEIPRELARRNIIEFTKYTFPKYETSRHNILTGEYLDKWVNGEIKRLMIKFPPRHGKSELAARRLPPFVLGRDPESEVVLASYDQGLVNKHSRVAKNIVESWEYKELFPNIIPAERWAVEEWEIMDGSNPTGNQMAIGSFKGVGREGGLTGRGFKYGIIDDIFKDRKEAESLTIRDGVWDWYTSVFSTRSAPDARILIIMTQWHEDDLCGRILKAVENGEIEPFVILNLVAMIENEEDKANDPLGRDIGEVLWPERFDAEFMKMKKKDVGDYDWHALYKGTPKSKKSKKIRREWFEVTDYVPEGLRWVRFWDLAVTKKTTADRTASAGMARDNDGYFYIRDITSEQETWPIVRRHMLQMMKIEGSSTEYGIEQAGQQAGFIDDVKSNPEFMPYSIKGYTVDSDKLTRALPWIARAQDGKIRLVRGTWIAEFLSVCDEFTGLDDKRDDEIDAVSGAYRMLCSEPEVRIRRI